MKEIAFGRSSPARLDLDPSVVQWLGQSRRVVSHRAGLVWAEHCTDCAMPACYSSCSLYSPRPDLKCRRLAQGVQAVNGPADLPAPGLMQIRFRKWGKLEATGSAKVLAANMAAQLESLGEAVEAGLNAAPLPFDLARRVTWAINRRVPRVGNKLSAGYAEGFLFEAVNPAPETRRLLLTLRPDQGDKVFQHPMVLPAGNNRIYVPLDQWVAQGADLDHLIIQIEPQDENPAPLLVGFADFVRLSGPLPDNGPGSSAAAKDDTARPAVKCVVWDLDNTLWAGVLVEDGLSGVKLDQRAVDAIVALDERGILNSISSKNSPAEALEALKHFGLLDYFVHPTISWDPKSQSIKSLATKLNINSDTFLFVDDQPFERAEISAQRPEVETFDPANIDDLMQHPRLKGENSREARQRRVMYQQAALREEAMTQSGSEDISDFLKSCEMKLVIDTLSATNIDRAFELTERTNQLNYAGARLGRSALESVMQDTGRLGLVLSAADRFGDYGIIGFAVIDTGSWTVDNFFMSCRVQRKKVDHAFFRRLSEIAFKAGAKSLGVVYRQTAKNGPSREVLETDMALPCETGEGLELFQIVPGQVIPQSDVVQVLDSLG